MRWRERRQRRWALLALILGLLGMTGVAVASHVDSMFKTGNFDTDCFDGTLAGPRQLCQTDNSALTVWRENSLTLDGRRNIGQMLDDQFRPSDLSVTFEAPVFSGLSETDIIYVRRDVPADLAGLTWCNDAIFDTSCDQHYVAFQFDTPSPVLACHESGHGVGLTHGNDASPKVSDSDESLGCMQRPLPFGNDGRLGTHNRELIDATY